MVIALGWAVAVAGEEAAADDPVTEADALLPLSLFAPHAAITTVVTHRAVPTPVLIPAAIVMTLPSPLTATVLLGTLADRLTFSSTLGSCSSG
jgi:hypothetical protein